MSKSAPPLRTQFATASHSCGVKAEGAHGVTLCFSGPGNRGGAVQLIEAAAGSGALGIEALSRGAASALFVDKDRQSTAAIEKNLAKANLRGRVFGQDVFAFLRRFSSTEKFEIIFADPPYERTKSDERFTEKLLADEKVARLLANNGIFVLEKNPSDLLPEAKLWEIIRKKKFGATEVLFLQRPRQQEPIET